VRTIGKTSRVGLLRTASQRIVGSTFRSVAEAGRFMLAMQGQDYASVKWSLGLRVPGSTEAEVEAAFTSGALVRSWPMRGTLHVTAPEDLPWLLDLLGPRIVKSLTTRRASLHLDDKTLERARNTALRALAGGTHKTREQMQTLWEQAGISTAGQRGYHLLVHLSLDKTLCLGPPQGKEQTFVLLSEWVKKPRVLQTEEAMGELARRYFQSHGPATLKDFAGWAKLGLKEAKDCVALAGKSLTTLSYEGAHYFLSPHTEDLLARAMPHAEDAVHALPGFDELVLGYKERDAIIDPNHFERVVPGGNGMFMATMVSAGRVVGTWRRTHKAKETVVEALPFAALSRTQAQAFSRAAQAYGSFMGVTVRVMLPS
jgi:hypothetical protein